METTPGPDEGPEPRLVGVDRVLAVLTELAGHPQGASLDDLSRAVGSPKPTVHRALGALRRSGFARLAAPGRYVLGDEFLRLAFAHHDARPEHLRVLPALEQLAARYGETTHYAVLEGDEVVYRSKVDPPSGAIRLTSTVGGRNPAHTTGVGKLLLARTLPDDDAVRAWVGTRTLERRTPRTLTTAEELVVALATVRAQGYALDEEENEPGIGCLAVPAPPGPAGDTLGAVSISALLYRTPLATLVADLPTIRGIVASAPAKDLT